MSDPDGLDIDPSWWAAPFATTTELGGRETPELLSLSFRDLLKAPELPELQRRVLVALVIATSAMLEPGNWHAPFKPAIQLGDRRSALPIDLDQEQLALLSRLVPLITQATLRARVADVAWHYGNRADVALANVAIDAYRSMPLESPSWTRLGRDSWRRAFEILRRQGPAGRERISEMQNALQDRILAGVVSDGFMITSLSDLLRSSARVDAPMARKLAEHIAGLAATAAGSNSRLARRLEREASTWFLKCSDQTAANDCMARVAEIYVAEADECVTRDPSRPMVDGILLERAIATIRALPRAYRDSVGLDSRIIALRARLAESREVTLESMITIRSGPVDLIGYVTAAQQCVAGKRPFEALISFSTIQPLMEADQAVATAKDVIKGSLAHLVGRSTFSHDGRKVAATGGTGDKDAASVWSEVVRGFAFRVELIVAGLVLPAKEVLTLEHRYDLSYVRSICTESPTVPPGHVELWSRGLWHGLNDDYLSAAAVLIPQLEHLIRYHLKTGGAYTLMVDDVTGVESEKGLNALLGMTEAHELLGPDLTMELRALLIEQEGANLRNHVAHGLLTDSEALSYYTVYAWWLCLRLVVIPLTLTQIDQDGDAVHTDVQPESSMRS